MTVLHTYIQSYILCLQLLCGGGQVMECRLRLSLPVAGGLNISTYGLVLGAGDSGGHLGGGEGEGREVWI